MKRFLLSTIMIVAMMLGAPNASAFDKNDQWLVYWYVCGSDLETKYGSATSDLNEMLQIELPSNVNVLIQAGGANEWQNDVVKNDRLNRFVFNAEGLYALESLPDADMGDPNTLAEFVRFGAENFDADHLVFIFWDHGGGSLGGVCSDERSHRSLRLDEIHDVFDRVFHSSEANPPFELIGFDACLMATFETAHALHGFTRYMVASEEIEPGNGWNYSAWLGALGNDPALEGDKLGQIICDTYLAHCQDNWRDEMATLSVIDMKKFPELRAAYQAFGLEALRRSDQNPQRFFSAFGRNASRAENYGGNNKEQGYFDMVDLADLAHQSSKLLPRTSQRLIDAVDDAVIYSVNGPYRDQGSGLSGYYPYDGDAELFEIFNYQQVAPFEHKCLYYHQVYGVMPDSARDLLESSTSRADFRLSKPKETIKLFDVKSLENAPVKLEKDGSVGVRIDQKALENISTVRCNLAYVMPEEELVLYLGTDANVISDWERGTFKSNFQGAWGMLEGRAIYMGITAEEDGYNIYAIPIKLNGVPCNLHVIYDYKTNAYKILGARGGIANGMADKNLIKIKKGDEITTIMLAMPLGPEDADVEGYDVETFTVGEELTFEDRQLGDGEYVYCFEFVTPNNEVARSQLINYTIKDGEIKISEIG